MEKSEKREPQSQTNGYKPHQPSDMMVIGVVNFLVTNYQYIVVVKKPVRNQLFPVIIARIERPDGTIVWDENDKNTNRDNIIDKAKIRFENDKPGMTTSAINTRLKRIKNDLNLSIILDKLSDELVALHYTVERTNGKSKKDSGDEFKNRFIKSINKDKIKISDFKNSGEEFCVDVIPFMYGNGKPKLFSVEPLEGHKKCNPFKVQKLVSLDLLNSAKDSQQGVVEEPFTSLESQINDSRTNHSASKVDVKEAPQSLLGTSQAQNVIEDDTQDSNRPFTSLQEEYPTQHQDNVLNEPVCELNLTVDQIDPLVNGASLIPNQLDEDSVQQILLYYCSTFIDPLTTQLFYIYFCPLTSQYLSLFVDPVTNGLVFASFFN
ncbi:hypothetical protein EIN_080700 [Entamoeba invadens IP1]|uniref:hypothetical protein n=1 Tax=Entamoeba invadens IP1 TaxID=370355 RepID=UPI0002C3E40B|nr:hypothetical protein EIN_080700 [Entamoeba invadens IP1]ELP85098.1 hypothetical protein EIN_080700 [Entamoeba invadens IP1]|eukprot:XP_004184444.1 hypothetical protein EIN_080700 [Entamoeba invadens IP1]